MTEHILYIDLSNYTYAVKARMLVKLCCDFGGAVSPEQKWMTANGVTAEHDSEMNRIKVIGPDEQTLTLFKLKWL